MELQFVKIFNKLFHKYSKEYIRENLLKLLYDLSKKHTSRTIIACHSASSCKTFFFWSFQVIPLAFQLKIFENM